MTVKIIRFPAPVSRLGYYGHICSYHICFVVQYEFSIDDFAIRKQQFRCNYISSKIRLESIKHTESLCWVTASPSSRQNQVPVIGKNSADKSMSPFFVMSLLFGLAFGQTASLCAPSEYTIHVEKRECAYCLAINTTICAGFCMTRQWQEAATQKCSVPECVHVQRDVVSNSTDSGLSSSHHPLLLLPCGCELQVW
ncbi:thyrotropin subunit beta isoform X2 [Aquila chrysaetos chrysaetos]|uniref:thyrotropin subunit beta isoform X2 n=1 Tax=Aquila chrysaetos chrysaetos TaxID=223781 RepID=UPI001176691A|nr:thyrotropin subunit beta isoform X2 [Aquila chrysaetos chrysaetos]